MATQKATSRKQTKKTPQRIDEIRKKRRLVIEQATDIVIELYSPALKELAKY